jgi:hypothetical protein
MSLFRAITAEEEAATSLILALKARQYPNATTLDQHNHVHKSAVTPYLHAVNNLIAATNCPKTTLIIHTSGEPQIHIKLEVTNLLSANEPIFAHPDQPLNFSMTEQEQGEIPTTASVTTQLGEIAKGAKMHSIRHFVKHAANIRNQIIYSSDEGIPSVKIEDEAILTRLSRVTTIHVLTIMIMQTTDHQLFAQQCLDGFIKMLSSIKSRL